MGYTQEWYDKLLNTAQFRVTRSRPGGSGVLNAAADPRPIRLAV